MALLGSMECSLDNNGREAVRFADNPETSFPKSVEHGQDELIKYYIVFMVMTNSLYFVAELTAMQHKCVFRFNEACCVTCHIFS